VFGPPRGSGVSFRRRLVQKEPPNDQKGRSIAMAKRQTATVHVARTPRKRPGIHAKAGSSQQKQSKLYKKKYRGQGR